jgi:hypothetical protein
VRSRPAESATGLIKKIPHRGPRHGLAEPRCILWPRIPGPRTFASGLANAVRRFSCIPLQAGIDAHLVGPWLGTENRITIRQRSLLFLSYIVVILPKTVS